MLSSIEGTIVGYLGSDPEKREVGGTTVCNFSIAVTESWADRNTNEKREKTTWYRVAAWGKLGENAATYLKKGSPVLVKFNGVSASAYTNNSGDNVASVEIRASFINYLPSGNRNGEPNNGNANQAAPPAPMSDIPF